MPVVRSTIAFSEKNWKKLQNAKNRSKTVNKAVAYFFASQEYLQTKELEFIEKELQHYTDTGESYSFKETFK